MPCSEPSTSSLFDQALTEVTGLTWLPWVGTNYANLPEGRRVLVVGESHYSPFQEPERAAKDIAEYMADPLATRKQVEQTLIANAWSASSLNNLHTLLYSPKHRAAFWGDLCYYNFIQRPMHYRRGSPERPSGQDVLHGWQVFLEVIKTLRPDHVLFIGVEASNHFHVLMEQWQIGHSRIEALDWINGTHTRRASVELDGRSISLHWVRHCGSHFSTDRWREYLELHARPMMESISISAGNGVTESPIRRLHVLGMAKSSLDLRGAKSQKLELDFLRLAYAVRDFREAGEQAIGYLMVLVPEVARTAEGWRAKYHSGDGVVILCESIEGDNLESLIKEKADNAAGLLLDRRFEEAERELSLAELGKKLGETSLKKLIESRHAGVTQSADPPLDIEWDYYGTLTPSH